MARPALSDRMLTPEEYLEMERKNPVKHEYVAGAAYAMTRTSHAHNLITGNLYILLRQHLRGTPCRVYMADVKVRIEGVDAFYYPDLMVSCEQGRDRYYREQPVLIVEVLSESTAKRDMGEKWQDYQTLSSLAE